MSNIFNIDGDGYIEMPSSLYKSYTKVLIFIQILIEFLADKRIKCDRREYINGKELREFLGDDLFVSPSRIASVNYILNQMHNGKIPDDINMIDFGCGRGHYSVLFKKNMRGKEYNYLGIDISRYSEWELYKNHQVGFVRQKAPFQYSAGEKVNFIFSQSSLEHVANDIDVLLWLARIFPQARQLHLVPAPISGFNYLAHGHRRYSYSELLSVTKKINRKIDIVPIGGNFCFNIYFSYYKDLTKTKHRLDFRVNKSIVYDPVNMLDDICSVNKGNYPVFYALWIYEEGFRS